MKQLMQLRLFTLLTHEIEDNQVMNEIPKAYEEFAVKILDKLKVRTDISELYYNLGFIHLELLELQDRISGEKGKKSFGLC